jgi:transposase
MAYDKKYRERAVEYRKEGHTQEATAKVFKISVSTLKSWIKKLEETGTLENVPLKRKPKKVEPKKLEAYYEKYPDAYLSEAARHFGCTEEAIRQNLKKLKITRKKRPSASKNKTPKK